MRTLRCRALPALSLVLALTLPNAEAAADGPAQRYPTATPIKHLVVLYLENSSFDRYFGAYPDALNPTDAPQFEAASGTPSVNGLTATLLEHNPNLRNPLVDGAPAGSNPFRIARLDSYTCDMNHDYPAELAARNQGLMDSYVEFGDKKGAQDDLQFCHENAAGQLDTDLGYFDGNTVTALWHYAQYFAISDNFFATSSGESTRGHVNLIAGDIANLLCAEADRVYLDGDPTNFPVCGAGPASSTGTRPQTDPDGITATLVQDADGFWDVCAETKKMAAIDGRNIGDLLTAAGLPWGWFQGGFALDAAGECSSSHFKVAYCAALDPSLQTDCESQLIDDYEAHYNPFQLFQSTANPAHLPPSSIALIGHDDQANHIYDLGWFWEAASRGNLPAVAFLKPPVYQSGHPGSSEPLDEQYFIVDTLNRLQRLPEWRHMAVFVAWDDSDGWYDHVMPPIVNRSATSFETGSAGEPLCGTATDGAGARCSYGPRLPFLLVSPWARENHVSSALADQTSILRFIEDNWLDGERISRASFDNIAGALEDLFDFEEPNPRRVFLDPASGAVTMVRRPRHHEPW